ncbi:unnamed protein product, partial [Timema podura]|nr:unnamed protein product [Timema podura]
MVSDKSSSAAPEEGASCSAKVQLISTLFALPDMFGTGEPIKSQTQPSQIGAHVLLTTHALYSQKDQAKSKKALKKEAKDAAKSAKKEERKSVNAGQQDAEAEDYSSGNYGQPAMIQSEEKLSRTFVDVKDLSEELAEQKVWVRGRLHTSRAKGKQCFVVVRQQQYTVQCLIAVNEDVSKQMVKFASKL